MDLRDCSLAAVFFALGLLAGVMITAWIVMYP